MQDLESRAPMTERTLFRIYSMTKPVTAVAAMMLHEEGRFNLDDPVSKFIPEFANVKVGAVDGTTRTAAQSITVQDLLLHTSGLNHRTSEIYRRERVRSRTQPLPEFIENIVRVPLMEDPGTRYRYPDYLRFAQMLLNKGQLDGVRLLKASTVERITANGLPEAIQKARGNAMGWGLANVNVDLRTGEYGWDGTAGTIFWVDPSRQRIAILMTQSAPANPDQIRQRFKAIIDQVRVGAPIPKIS